jgi:hypothetical protein
MLRLRLILVAQNSNVYAEAFPYICLYFLHTDSPELAGSDIQGCYVRRPFPFVTKTKQIYPVVCKILVANIGHTARAEKGH